MLYVNKLKFSTTCWFLIFPEASHESRIVDVFAKIDELSTLLPNKFRSGHQMYSVRKGTFKDSAIFTGKHLCWSLT